MGERCAELFEGLLEAGEGRVRGVRPAATLAVEGAELPPWRFQHLEVMDGCAIPSCGLRRPDPR